MLWRILQQGPVALLYVVSIEMEGIGAVRAGSATGVVNASGFSGGVLMPLLGMRLVQITPVLGIGFWTGCYVLSALCFSVIRETDSRPAGRRMV